MFFRGTKLHPFFHFHVTNSYQKQMLFDTFRQKSRKKSRKRRFKRRSFLVIYFRVVETCRGVQTMCTSSPFGKRCFQRRSSLIIPPYVFSRRCTHRLYALAFIRENSFLPRHLRSKNVQKRSKIACKPAKMTSHIQKVVRNRVHFFFFITLRGLFESQISPIFGVARRPLFLIF